MILFVAKDKLDSCLRKGEIVPRHECTAWVMDSGAEGRGRQKEAHDMPSRQDKLDTPTLPSHQLPTPCLLCPSQPHLPSGVDPESWVRLARIVTSGNGVSRKQERFHSCQIFNCSESGFCYSPTSLKRCLITISLNTHSTFYHFGYTEQNLTLL